MIRRCARALAALLALAGLIAASGCTTAPATGRTFFTGGLSAEEEAELGAQEHEKIVAQFGGVYEDPELATYISSIGNLLARSSETPELAFTFTVLDTPMVNAFALPGGYVYVTRGLLALAEDEAELASVLAHEIGHVTARHSAERYGQSMAANLAGLGLGVLFGSQALSQAFGVASEVALRSFSREQEYEADLLGVRYMRRVGYDAAAAASLLAKLLVDSRLEAELRGEPGSADQFNIMQTHPRTADRIARAMSEAGTAPARDPMRARDIYLGEIDGMLYGDTPEQGFIRGRRFLHPELRFAFEVPEGFRLFNSARRILARGPDGAAMLFDQAKVAPGQGMAGYLTQVWAQGVRLNDVEPITVNGMDAATGWTRLRTRDGARDVRLVAIRYGGDVVYRMQFATPRDLTGPLSRALREATYSFRKLSAAEAARLQPLRLALYEVRPGDTPATIAAKLPFADYRLERFLTLNGLDAHSTLSPGQVVKIVR